MISEHTYSTHKTTHKQTAVQDEDALSYCRMRGLYSLVVVFAATIIVLKSFYNTVIRFVYKRTITPILFITLERNDMKTTEKKSPSNFTNVF